MTGYLWKHSICRASRATEFADMGNIAKNVLGVQQATVQPEQGTLTVRAPVRV